MEKLSKYKLYIYDGIALIAIQKGIRRKIIKEIFSKKICLSMSPLSIENYYKKILDKYDIEVKCSNFLLTFSKRRNEIKRYYY